MADKFIEMLPTIIQAGVIFLIGFGVIKLILLIMKRALKKSTVDPSLHKFLHNAVQIVLMIVLILIVLSHLKIQTASLVTLLGVGTAAIALALKDSLSNVAGGIVVMFTKPFTQDDFVDIDGTQGLVQHIDLMLTTLKTYDNKVVTIPNGKVVNAVIVNYSREELRRVDLKLGIAYGADLQTAREVLLRLAADDARVLGDPAPFVGVASCGDSAVELDYRVWTKTENYWDVQYDLSEGAKLAFEKAGIEIPYPQMDVHLVQPAADAVQ